MIPWPCERPAIVEDACKGAERHYLGVAPSDPGSARGAKCDSPAALRSAAGWGEKAGDSNGRLSASCLRTLPMEQDGPGKVVAAGGRYFSQC